jgi:very-short-patch-repair endonuclease
MLDKRLLKFAREGRKDATHTEKMLWRALRDRRQDGLKFRRQAVIGEYIADFYCAEHRLIVEVDGDIHDLESVQRHDVFRQQTLEMAGYRVVRFSGDEVYKQLDWVIEKIVAACREPSPPTPLPVGQGEGS